MKDIVTAETALELKNAGFPQPAPEFGQTWYSKNGTKFLVYAVDGKRADIISESGQTWIGRFLDDGDMIYAPSDAELIMALRFWQVTTRDVNDVEQYAVSHFGGDYSTKKNLVLSEALAMAYIDEKTPRPPILYKKFQGEGYTATFECQPGKIDMKLLNEIADYFKSIEV